MEVIRSKWKNVNIHYPSGIQGRDVETFIFKYILQPRKYLFEQVYIQHENLLLETSTELAQTTDDANIMITDVPDVTNLNSKTTVVCDSKNTIRDYDGFKTKESITNNSIHTPPSANFKRQEKLKLKKTIETRNIESSEAKHSAAEQDKTKKNRNEHLHTIIIVGFTIFALIILYVYTGIPPKAVADYGGYANSDPKNGEGRNNTKEKNTEKTSNSCIVGNFKETLTEEVNDAGILTLKSNMPECYKNKELTVKYSHKNRIIEYNYIFTKDGQIDIDLFMGVKETSLEIMLPDSGDVVAIELDKNSYRYIFKNLMKATIIWGKYKDKESSGKTKLSLRIAEFATSFGYEDDVYNNTRTKQKARKGGKGYISSSTDYYETYTLFLNKKNRNQKLDIRVGCLQSDKRKIQYKSYLLNSGSMLVKPKTRGIDRLRCKESHNGGNEISQSYLRKSFFGGNRINIQ